MTASFVLIMLLVAPRPAHPDSRVAAGCVGTSEVRAHECPVSQSPAVSPHRLFDRANDVLFAGEIGALVMDGWSTQRNIGEIPNTSEADPLMRWFVDKGWPGQVLAGTLVMSSQVWLSYILHRHGHHRWERVTAISIIAGSATSGLLNWHEFVEYRHGR